MTAVLRLRAGAGPGPGGLLRSRPVQHAITVFAALATTRLLARFGGIPPEAALVVPPFVLALWLFLRHPKWALAALIASTVLGLYVRSTTIGPVNIRVTDLPLLFLVPWAILNRARTGRQVRPVIGEQFILLVCGAIGFTLVFALVRDPSDAARSVVAYLRFVSTVALVWLVPAAIRTAGDALFLLRTVAVCCTFELLWAIARQPSVFAGTRLRGSNGATVEGLLAAALILLALFSPAPSSRWARAGMFTLGAMCLYFTSSIGALAAVGVTIGLFGFRRRAGQATRSTERLLRPTRFLVLGVGCVALVSLVRPIDLPTSQHFTQSSGGHRLLYGLAGLKVFAANPIFGVGWQRSSRPEIIASRELVEDLREDFPNFREVFYPVIGKTRATVHNAYVQMLAESGVIGGAIFAVAIVAVARRVRRMLAGLRGTVAAAGQMAAILVVASMVWLNDNPLFGAQPETVLLFTMLGMLAAVAALPPPRAEPPPGSLAVAGGAAPDGGAPNGRMPTHPVGTG